MLAAPFGAQYVRRSVIDFHTEEWFWSGAFFALAVSQGLLGAGLAVTRSRRLALAAIAVSLLATWLRALDRHVGAFGVALAVGFLVVVA